MFRIYAHVYLSHIDHIRHVEAHLNDAFKHFYLFVKHYDLMNKQDMAPLHRMIDRIEEQLLDDGEHSGE